MNKNFLVLALVLFSFSQLSCMRGRVLITDTAFEDGGAESLLGHYENRLRVCKHFLEKIENGGRRVKSSVEQTKFELHETISSLKRSISQIEKMLEEEE